MTEVPIINGVVALSTTAVTRPEHVCSLAWTGGDFYKVYCAAVMYRKRRKVAA